MSSVWIQKLEFRSFLMEVASTHEDVSQYVCDVAFVLKAHPMRVQMFMDGAMRALSIEQVTLGHSLSVSLKATAAECTQPDTDGKLVCNVCSEGH